MNPAICTFIHTYVHTYVTALPGYKLVLHGSTSTFGPLQSFPPQEGTGLLHTLVRCRVPPPQLLLHDPYLHELQPPATTQ